MFDSPILDLVIILSFTYFMLGLLVSTIHEFIFSVVMPEPKRASYLRESIECLFFEKEWKKFAKEKLFENIHFQAIKSNENKFPSYVPNANFALAVLDQFRDGDNLLDMGRIRDILTNNHPTTATIPGSLRKMLLSMFERANGDLAVFQSQIESYFNTAMDRLGGSYVRSTKRYILAIATILAVSLNVDTIHIVKTLWESPDALQQTADKIQATVKVIDSTGGTYSIKSPDGNKVVLYSRVQVNAGDTVDPNDPKKRIPLIKESIKQTELTLKASGIPIGWDSTNYPHKSSIDTSGKKVEKSCSSLFCDWAIKIFGLLLTSFALLLGAPFWFDLLNKFVNIRAASKKDSDVDKPDAKPVQPITVTYNPPGEGAVG